MTRKLRVAIIGCGFIAHYHARALKKCDQAELVAVCDMDKQRVVGFAQAYGIARTVTDPMELMAEKGIDAMILAVPNQYHAPYAIECLRRDKDVFIEKPIAVGPGEGEEIMRVAREKGRLVMVGHMWRFDLEVNYIRRQVVSGTLGRIVKTRGLAVHQNWGPGGWFTNKDLAGGGALIDMGVHAIDTTRYLLGDPSPENIYACIGTYYGDYEVDDSGVILITWENGATSIIECGWWQPHADGPEAATRLYGTRGYASLFPTFVTKKGQKNTETVTPAFPAKKEHCDQSIYTRQMSYFLDCLRTRKNPVPGLKEGQMVLKIVAAAYRSAATSEVVKL